MRKYGFNFQWMYHYEAGKAPEAPDERALDFMADHGLDFVRVPLSYRFWCPDFDYFNPNEGVFDFIDNYLAACRKRGLHLSLNLHRAPGYCINGNHLEKHNLWRESIAQDAFIFYWRYFAERYKGISNNDLSFDLINEPPDVGQYGMTRAHHEKVIRAAVVAIREISPDREIVIDGLCGGNLAMPELADLNIVHSGRGYQPMPVSHYQASWWPDHKGLSPPVYPGTKWEGQVWTIDTIRAYYQPWRDVEDMGVRIHIGEFGCYNKVPNDLALRWLSDLLSVFHEFGWGYALWNFQGDFGIAEHGRPGTEYSVYHGYKIDKRLLALYLANRTKPLAHS